MGVTLGEIPRSARNDKNGYSFRILVSERAVGKPVQRFSFPGSTNP